MPTEMSLVSRLRIIFQACGAKLAIEAAAAKYPNTVMIVMPVERLSRVQVASGVMSSKCRKTLSQCRTQVAQATTVASLIRISP